MQHGRIVNAAVLVLIRQIAYLNDLHTTSCFVKEQTQQSCLLYLHVICCIFSICNLILLLTLRNMRHAVWTPFRGPSWDVLESFRNFLELTFGKSKQLLEGLRRFMRER